MATARNSFVLAVVCTLAALGLIAPATAAALEPALSLEKGITEVGGKEVIGAPKPSVTAGGGEPVTYELDLENAGGLAAEAAEVWDVLPAGIDCTDVTLPAQTPPQAATCTAGTIKWTGVAIPIGALTALTYEATIPTDAAPGHAFVNHAGVTHYMSGVGTGDEVEYVPSENIDPSRVAATVGPLLARAEVTTTAATLEQSTTTGVTQPGNGPGMATIGEVVHYKVTATIPPNSKIYGTPVLKDELPPNLELLGTPAAELDGTALPSEGVTLASNSAGAEVLFNGPFPATVGAQEHTVVLTLEGRVRNLATNRRGVTITNTASFEFDDGEGGTPTVLEKSLNTPVVEPDLEVQKHLLPDGRSPFVEPGEVVEYEDEVSNLTGSSTANEVTVVDTVPTGMTIADPGSGTQVGDTIVWHLGPIAPGATEGLTYKLEVTKPATATEFTNVVEATTQSLFDEPEGVVQPETRLASFVEGAYEAAEEGYAAEAEDTVSLAASELAVETTPSAGTTVAGTNDKYEVTVSNSGTGAAHEVEVKAVLSKGQEFRGPATAVPSTGFAQKAVEANTPGPGETTVVWTVAEVKAGTAVEIEVPIKTAPSLNDDDEVTALATVSSPSQAEEPAGEGSFVVHREADLSIEKTAAQEDVNAGEVIDYELKVENHGPSDASGIVVTDELPESTVFKSADPGCAQAAGTVTCKLAALAVGEPPHTFHLAVQVKSGTSGIVENTATVKGDQPQPGGGDQTESTARTSVVGLAALSIGVAAPTQPVLLGSQFTYELTVENDGPSDAVKTVLEDALPPQVKFVAATTSVGTCDEAPAALVTCKLKRLLPHTKATVLVTVTAAELGTVTNVASVVSESSPERKVGEATVQIVPVPVPAGPPAPAASAPDLKVVKTVDTANPVVGTPFAYRVDITNLSGAEAKGVKVLDTMSRPVKVVSLDGGPGHCGAAGTKITCAIPNIAVGKTVHITYTVVAEAPGRLKNTVSAEAANGESSPQDNRAVKTVTVKYPPGAGPALTLQVNAPQGKVRPTAVVPLRATVAASTARSLRNLQVCDTLSAGLVLLRAPGASRQGNAVCWHVAKLARGAQRTFTATARVAASALGTFVTRTVARADGVAAVRRTSRFQVTPLPPRACGSSLAQLLPGNSLAQLLPGIALRRC